MLIHVLALLSLLVPASRQDPGPDPARIEKATEALEAAFKDGDAAARVAAIRASVEVVDKRVIGLVARGLKDRQDEVASAALDALGRMRHPQASKELIGYYKLNKKTLLADDGEARLVELLKAVGRQGDPDGIAVLGDDPTASRGYPVIQARFLGLGAIRDARSIEAVFELMKRVGKNKLEDYMGDVRLGLMALTGEDRGMDSLQWEAWWRDNRKGYEVSKEAKALPEPERARWNAYWGIEAKKKDGDKD